MSKLCTLKEVIPGSVIEVPKDYRGHEGELAVILDLECTGNDIRASLLRKSGIQPLGKYPSNTEVIVVEDSITRREATRDFIAKKFTVPELALSSGCDPEIFAVHGDGTIFPAWEYMPDENTARAQAKEWKNQTWVYEQQGDSRFTLSGGKSDWELPDNNYPPLKVPAYWDGAQAEFAPFAKNCLETLHDGTRAGLKMVLDYARAKDPQAKLTLQNVVELPEAVLWNAEDKYIQFHCSESYNIYDDCALGGMNARKYKYRCAGGHIHIGYNRKFTAPGIEEIVRGLDGVLGVASVGLATGIDNPERRNTYGRAGEFRLPKHGLEYRVLSNFWLSHPAIAMLVFELTRTVVRFAESGLFNLCWIADEQETREVINNCDVKGARNIMLRNKAVMESLLASTFIPNGAYRTPDSCKKMQDTAIRAIMGGLGAILPDPTNIEANWNLNGQWIRHCHGKTCNWASLCETL